MSTLKITQVRSGIGQSDRHVGTLRASGLVRKLSVDVKVLGEGELTKKLTVSAHGFSKSAVEKIEAAGGSVTWLRGEPVEKKRKRHKQRAAAEPAETETADEVAETPEDAPDATTDDASEGEAE